MNKKQSQIKDVIVIGAGASGMMAAITAARRGRSVLILEHMDKVGKKILATGNGKCNYTNEYMTAECYHGNQRLLTDIRSQFERDDAIAFFRELGIWPKAKNWYYYPNSGQALSAGHCGPVWLSGAGTGRRLCGFCGSNKHRGI